MLKRHGFEFDEAHTSLLKRAVRTLWSSLHGCDQHWIPVHRSWRLNERHYGALTGMSKSEVKDQMGEELLQKFRRGFYKKPIEMRPDHPFFTGRDRRYNNLIEGHLPTGESLHDCQNRVLPCSRRAAIVWMRRGAAAAADVDIPWRCSRGAAAAATRIVRGDRSRRRRGCHADSPRRGVAAPPRPRRG